MLYSLSPIKANQENMVSKIVLNSRQTRWRAQQKNVYVWLSKLKDYFSLRQELLKSRRWQAHVKRGLLWKQFTKKNKLLLENRTTTDDFSTCFDIYCYKYNKPSCRRKHAYTALFQRRLRKQRVEWQRRIISQILLKKQLFEGKKSLRRRQRQKKPRQKVRANGRMLVSKRVSPKNFMVTRATELAISVRSKKAQRFCSLNKHGAYSAIEEAEELKKLQQDCVNAVYPVLVKRLNNLVSELNLRQRLWRREQKLQLKRYRQWKKSIKNKVNSTDKNFSLKNFLRVKTCWKKVKRKLRFIYFHALKQGISVTFIVAKAYGQGRSKQSLKKTMVKLKSIFKHSNRRVYRKYRQAQSAGEHVDLRKRVAALIFKEKYIILPKGQVGRTTKRLLDHDAWLRKQKKKLERVQKKYSKFKNPSFKREFQYKQNFVKVSKRLRRIKTALIGRFQTGKKLSKSDRFRIKKLFSKQKKWRQILKRYSRKWQYKKYLGNLEYHYRRWHRVGKGYRALLRRLRKGIVPRVRRPKIKRLEKKIWYRKQKTIQRNKTRLTLAYWGINSSRNAWPGKLKKRQTSVERNFDKLYSLVARKLYTFKKQHSSKKKLLR